MNELIIDVFQLCVLVGICLILNNESRKGSKDIINKMASIFCVERIYYGNGKEKPSEDCFYDKNSDIPGWYESDDSFKSRVLYKIRNPTKYYKEK